MRIGYACQTIGVPNAAYRTCTKKYATPDILIERIAWNLDVLSRVIDWNLKNGIFMFRISSDLVPFGSSPVNTVPWKELFAPKLAEIGEKIRAGGMRVSMHPGQYTVLNSPDPDVVRRAAEDLDYHAAVLDGMGLDETHKLILHVGGVYGDRPRAAQRFVENWKTLCEPVRRRLVIENDDRSWSAGEVFEIARALGIPPVFDNLHHRLNPTKTPVPAAEEGSSPGIRPTPESASHQAFEPPATILLEADADEAEWVRLFSTLWGGVNGRQKIHYSQQAEGQKPGAHSRSIAIEPFLRFVEKLNAAMPESVPDIMLEVKDKNLSAVKCICCTSPGRLMQALEKEWSRYKYTVLEHEPNVYREIRAFLADKTAPADAERAIGFYMRLEQALAAPIEPGKAENAALHVWGYMKNVATDRERAAFFTRLEAYRNGTGKLEAVRRCLRTLAEKYGQSYLTDSLYFDLDMDSAGDGE